MAMRWKRGHAKTDDTTNAHTPSAHNTSGGMTPVEPAGDGIGMDDRESPTASTGFQETSRPNRSDGGKSIFSRTAGMLKGYFGSHSPRFFIGVWCCVLGVVTLLLPSAYVVESPGPTQDVLGTAGGDQVIVIGGGHMTHKDSGKLLLVTVNASGTPEYPVTNAEALIFWMSAKHAVTPSEAVFPAGQSAEQYANQSKREMTGSQQSAARAALAYAKSLGIDTRGVKISMHVDDIGGPSAGMMYALGVLDKLTVRNETGGATIAGTGTIDARGEVGKIGGIRLKMLGARRDGATWFLAPQSNCAEVVGHVPQGLRDVKVSTLDDAYRALIAIGQGKGETLPHCAAKVR